MKIRLYSVLSLLLGLAACSQSGSNGKDTLSLTVETPEAMTTVRAHTLYQVFIESSDGETQFVLPVIPSAISDPENEASGVQGFQLVVDRKIAKQIDASEVAVGFRYITEDSVDLEEPVVLMQALVEVLWSHKTEVQVVSDDFDSASFDLDQDGLSNFDEVEAGLDPTDEDTDHDGVFDAVDAFPDISGEV